MIDLLFRAAAVLLVGGLFASATQAKVPTSHSGKARYKKANTSDASQWKPDAKLLSQLQPERQFGSFSMRIPVGFTAWPPKTASLNQGQTTLYAVKGPNRPDGSFLLILIVTGSSNPGYHTTSVDGLINSTALLNNKADVKKSEIQIGEVGMELAAGRQYFKYTDKAINMFPKYRGDPNMSLAAHGLAYATTNGQTDIVVAAIDAEPYNATSLPLAEAAVLTLRRTE